MLQANVNDLSKTLPPEMSGIFWMKGNSVSEELACVCWAAVSNCEGGVLITRPNNYFGWTYLSGKMGKIMSAFDSNMTEKGMMYFVFESHDFRYGRVYGSDSYNYQRLGGLYRLGKWTLERLPGEGVNFKRG